MSAEADLKEDLVAYAPLTAVVGTGNRIAPDKVPAGAARPFVVYVRQETEPITNLLGEKLAARITFELQCWADTRREAEELGDLVEAALAASTREPAGIPISDRSSAYDPDLDLEAVRLVVEWWEGA